MHGIDGRWLRSLRIAALLGTGACSATPEQAVESQSADTKAELLETYTDASKWCQRLDECEVEEPCQGLPSEDRVEAALEAFDEEDLEVCVRAVHFYEDCALPLSCGDFIDSYEASLCKSGAGPWERCCFDAEAPNELVPCEDPDPRCLVELQAASRLCEELENAIYDVGPDGV